MAITSKNPEYFGKVNEAEYYIGTGFNDCYLVRVQSEGSEPEILMRGELFDCVSRFIEIGLQFKESQKRINNNVYIKF